MSSSGSGSDEEGSSSSDGSGSGSSYDSSSSKRSRDSKADRKNEKKAGRVIKIYESSEDDESYDNNVLSLPFVQVNSYSPLPDVLLVVVS